MESFSTIEDPLLRLSKSRSTSMNVRHGGKDPVVIPLLTRLCYDVVIGSDVPARLGFSRPRLAKTEA